MESVEIVGEISKLVNSMLNRIREIYLERSLSFMINIDVIDKHILVPS